MRTRASTSHSHHGAGRPGLLCKWPVQAAEPWSEGEHPRRCFRVPGSGPQGFGSDASLEPRGCWSESLPGSQQLSLIGSQHDLIVSGPAASSLSQPAPGRRTQLHAAPPPQWSQVWSQASSSSSSVTWKLTANTPSQAPPETHGAQSQAVGPSPALATSADSPCFGHTPNLRIPVLHGLRVLIRTSEKVALDHKVAPNASLPRAGCNPVPDIALSSLQGGTQLFPEEQALTADSGRLPQTGFWEALASLPEQQSFRPNGTV
nr:uncharacterized protein LOC108178574 [Oryctolagus cuniculus]